MKVKEKCPHCGGEIERYRNPVPTADAIIELSLGNEDVGIVLIKRKNYPFGWAIPGGFVDYGETVEQAAVREAKEETGLDVELQYLLGVYSDPQRDPRGHTISCVFIARASGEPKAADDAENAQVFPLTNLPGEMAFDHAKVVQDYLTRRNELRK